MKGQILIILTLSTILRTVVSFYAVRYGLKAALAEASEAHPSHYPDSHVRSLPISNNLQPSTGLLKHSFLPECHVSQYLVRIGLRIISQDPSGHGCEHVSIPAACSILDNMRCTNTTQFSLLPEIVLMYASRAVRISEDRIIRLGLCQDESEWRSICLGRPARYKRPTTSLRNLWTSLVILFHIVLTLRFYFSKAVVNPFPVY